MLTFAAASALTGCSGDDSSAADSGATSTSTAASAAGSGPARNPYLAADKFAVTHLDPAQSDSFPAEVPRGTFGAGGSPDRLVDVIANGPVAEPPHGMQRFEWDPKAHRWNSVWARGDVVSTSMVPAVSTGAGIVFVNGYSEADGWELTGLDWKTGETVHRTIFGQTNLGDGAYVIVEAFPNGDLLFNSIGGPFRAEIGK